MMKSMNGHKHGLRALALILLCLASGCGFYLSDDVDLTLNFLQLLGPSDELHSPYVKGARFGVYLHETGGGPSKVKQGWRIESERPGVLAIEKLELNEYEGTSGKHRYLRAAAVAVDEGQADLIVRDEEGHEVYRSSVEVLRPDRIELLAHGPLLLRRPEEQAVVQDPQVLVGGTATFLVRYYRGGRLLSGNGALGIAGGDGASGQARKTFLFEDRDWLTVTVQREGAASVDLLVAGEQGRRATFIGVNEGAVSKVVLSPQVRGEERAQKGDWLVVLGEALDAMGRPIFGVEYTWSFGGKAESGLGDLYRYEYAPDMRKLLTADHGSHHVELMIQAKQGFVDSTNRLGCSAAGRAPAGLLLPGALAGLLLAGARRRRGRIRGE